MLIMEYAEFMYYIRRGTDLAITIYNIDGKHLNIAQQWGYSFTNRKWVPNPLYLPPPASVDLGNTLRGQLKFSLRSADKGERGKVEDGAERGLLISKLLSLFVPYQKEGDYADFDLWNWDPDLC